MMIAGLFVLAQTAFAVDASSTIALASGSPAAANLASLLTEARARNPEIREARAMAEAARARIWSGYALPDPQVEGARETSPGMGRDLYTVRQDLPFPGKRWAERAAAMAEAEAADQRARAVELEVVLRIKLAYYELVQSEGTIEALAGARAAMQQSATVAHSRVAGSRADADEYLLMQSEAVKDGAMLLEEQNGRAILETELGKLLNRPHGQAHFGSPSANQVVQPARSLDELLALAEAHQPDLLASRAEEAAAGALVRRAALEFAPDLMPFYQQQRYDDGSAGRMYGLGLTVPLWLWKPAAALRGARADREAATARRAAAEAALVQRVTMESIEVRTHYRKATDFGEAIMPLLEQAVRVAQANYAGGKGDVLRLLTAVRERLAAQQEYYSQVKHFGEHWAELERAVGVELEGTP